MQEVANEHMYIYAAQSDSTAALITKKNLSLAIVFKV